LLNINKFQEEIEESTQIAEEIPEEKLKNLIEGAKNKLL